MQKIQKLNIIKSFIYELYSETTDREERHLYADLEKVLYIRYTHKAPLLPLTPCPNTKPFINCFGQVVPPPPSVPAPPVPVKERTWADCVRERRAGIVPELVAPSRTWADCVRERREAKEDNVNIWAAVLERKQIKPEREWNEPEPEPEPEPQPDPREEVIKFTDSIEYLNYNKLLETDNNIKVFSFDDTRKKIAAVGDVFYEWIGDYRRFYIVTRVTSKSYFYKTLKGSGMAKYICNNKYGEHKQSKITKYYTTNNIIEDIEMHKRFTGYNDIDCINPVIHNYENGFLCMQRL
jgi:hypothetical protein